MFFAKYGDRPVFPMRIYSLQVNESNILSENQITYIDNEDDVITFNHKTGDAYINGEPVPFDFGADFFTLKKGFNSLVVLPENTFDKKVRFREKFR